VKDDRIAGHFVEPGMAFLVQESGPQGHLFAHATTEIHAQSGTTHYGCLEGPTSWEVPMQNLNSSYPATFSFDPPEKVANWRPLVNWLLAIPHLVILYGLRILAEAVGIISWFVILFTGELPEGFANIQAMFMRYELRTYTFYLFMCEEYPPFAFGMTPTDPGEEPRLHVEFRPQLTDRNRLTVGFRIILVIPQLIVVAVLELVGWVVSVIAFFAVLFTGRWPEGMRTFVLNVMRWYLRVQTYFLLLTDEYPPFAFDPPGT
jgi:hypothetical protein